VSTDEGVATENDDTSADDSMTLTEHLAELRVRIIRSALAVAIGMVLIIAFYDQVLEFLLQPYVDLCDRKPQDFCDPNLAVFSPTEGLATRVRVGLYGGIVMALPVILWQVWRFIVPALNKQEKKWAIPIVATSVVLFLAGGALAYFTIGQALDFLIGWSGSDVSQIYSVQSYVSLIGLMIFAFGLGFMLPVFVFGLQALGVITPKRLLQSWRIALVAIAVISAVITPSGDPVTMGMLGLPMVVLYFLAILLGWLVVRRRPTDA
jgi:sec-independent protein translocase protein TatC